jgi:hypothetical protein
VFGRERAGDYWLGVRPRAFMQSSNALARLPTPASAAWRSQSEASRLRVLALLLLADGGCWTAQPAIKSIMAASDATHKDPLRSSFTILNVLRQIQ